MLYPQYCMPPAPFTFDGTVYFPQYGYDGGYYSHASAGLLDGTDGTPDDADDGSVSDAVNGAVSESDEDCDIVITTSTPVPEECAPSEATVPMTVATP